MVAGDSPPLQTIGVAWDFSHEAAAALTVALDLAARSGAAVQIVHVLPCPDDRMPRSRGAASSASGTAMRREQVHHRVRAALAERPTSVPIDFRFPAGPPAAELAAVGSALDLLIVGARLHSTSHTLVTGNVVEHLTADCRAALLVVPRSTTFPVGGAPGLPPRVGG